MPRKSLADAAEDLADGAEQLVTALSLVLQPKVVEEMLQRVRAVREALKELERGPVQLVGLATGRVSLVPSNLELKDERGKVNEVRASGAEEA